MFLYALLVGTTSLVTAFDLGHAYYSFIQRTSLPPLVVSALTGLLNLSWYELSYVVGGGLKSVSIYLALPFMGAATGLVSAVSMVIPRRLRPPILILHFAFSVSVGILSLAVLSWRYIRGYGDLWRTITTIAFLAAYYAWIQYFRRPERAVNP